MIGLFLDGGIAAAPMNSDRRRDIVQVWIRVLTGPVAYRLGAQIRNAVIDKVNWKLGGDPDGIRVVQSLEWTPLQPLETGVAGAADTWLLSLLFETYASADGWRSEPAA